MQKDDKMTQFKLLISIRNVVLWSKNAKSPFQEGSYALAKEEKIRISPFHTEGGIFLRFSDSGFGILQWWFACFREFFIEDPFSLVKLYL